MTDHWAAALPMKIILLCHPPSLGSTSMPRFAHLIGEGMRQRGHEVEYLTSKVRFGRLASFVPSSARKWLGYIDQFLIFPRELRRRVRSSSKETLFVVADQALGMWVPMIRDRPHVIHCHDFLAQRSALGEFPENPTGWTGRRYQRLIRRGYRQGRAFISVSSKTRADLHRFLGGVPPVSEVVYNPLNYPFGPMDRSEALRILERRLSVDLSRGYILHVGGNQWYKNREGVVSAYIEYARLSERPLPLVLAGHEPTLSLRARAEISSGTIHFAVGLTDAEIHAAYAAAGILFFPSLEEGFGWPIIEAQACQCLVLTTDAPPMNEIAASAVFYVSRMPAESAKEWATAAGQKLGECLALDDATRASMIDAGRKNADRFTPLGAMEQFEKVYLKLLARWEERDA